MNSIFSTAVLPTKPIDDSFQAYLVENAFFTNTEEYPIIPSYMVPDIPPVKMMPYNKAIFYRGDLSDTYVCSYAPDKTFERIRRYPQRYISFFRRCAGLIGFDFSIHSDMPIIKQKSQLYDNLSLTYFYGSCGIPVIPNLRCGIDDLLPEFLDAIPKHVYVAVGTHGFIKRLPQQYEWYCFLEQIIDMLHPKGIIVYGTLNSPLFDCFKSETDFLFYEPWITKRVREVKQNGN